MHVLFLGTSFTGRYLAAQVADSSPAFEGVDRVSFVTRDPKRARNLGLHLYSPGDQGSVDLIVDTVPQLNEGRPAYCDLARGILDRTHAVYVLVSSTSVYAAEPEEERAFVDETSVPRGGSRRAIDRLALEETVRKEFPQARMLRSAGLYGPGRALPLSFARGDFERALSGNRVVSRIHVADLNRLALALAAPKTPMIVNGVDELPSENRVTFEFLEDLLSIQIPGSWRQDPPVGRAVRSNHVRALLGELLFPSFREGFLDVVNHARRDGLL